MSRIGVVYISDRKDLYLPACKESVAEHVDGPIYATTVIDDREHKLGMSGAVNAAWQWACEQNLDYILSVEEDFLFLRYINLLDLVDVLEYSGLPQVTLIRPPWSHEERQAGGVARRLGVTEADQRRTDLGVSYLEQRFIFSLNPCLIPRDVFEQPYPSGNEAGMTTQLREQGRDVFALYGRLDDSPIVEHVGHTRSQGWRL